MHPALPVKSRRLRCLSFGPSWVDGEKKATLTGFEPVLPGRKPSVLNRWTTGSWIHFDGAGVASVERAGIPAASVLWPTQNADMPAHAPQKELGRWRSKWRNAEVMLPTRQGLPRDLFSKESPTLVRFTFQKIEKRKWLRQDSHLRPAAS